ncbi:MAG: PAS domain-containing protein, partial [Kiritimatiellaeota bacterium]|nr:PAS domain-containing protein [Kiritimatiellota bacterium]
MQGVIETVEDITVRKRMDDALQRSHVDLNAILESTPDIICLLDAHDGRLQHFNAAFARETERTYGVHPQVGMTAQDILPADRVPAWTGFFQRALT